MLTMVSGTDFYMRVHHVSTGYLQLRSEWRFGFRYLVIRAQSRRVEVNVYYFCSTWGIINSGLVSRLCCCCPR